MDHTKFVEVEIRKTINGIDKLAKSLVLPANVDNEASTELMAFCYTTKQDLKKLQTQLAQNPRLDITRHIDDALERAFVGFVKIAGVETSHIRRCYKEHVR